MAEKSYFEVNEIYSKNAFFLREASVPIDHLRVPLGIEGRIAVMHTG